jgi:hypothetical protein
VIDLNKNVVRLVYHELEDSELYGRKPLYAEHYFDNGFGVSVVRHQFSYGGTDGLYELAVLDSSGSLHYDNVVANGDVRGHLTRNQVLVLAGIVEDFKNE